MDQRLKESISALMDDEANELELRRVLSQAVKGEADRSELLDTWSQYHEIKEVVQGDSSFSVSIDISTAVSNAIRNEDVDRAEGVGSVDGEDNTDTVDRADQSFVAAEHSAYMETHSEKANATKLFKRSRFGASVTAIAASFALAVLIVFQSGNDGPTSANQPLITGVESQTSEILQTGVPGSGLVNVAEHKEPKVLVELNAAQAKHFSQYLLRHAEHSVRGTQSGFMPLARVASVNSVGI